MVSPWNIFRTYLTLKTIHTPGTAHSQTTTKTKSERRQVMSTPIKKTIKDKVAAVEVK
ncbi:hypothetical protein [Candidatus Phytoplasma solani]|uniref:hypothetical protein n=1 Tax=Candidatus Phytoplasma solani TaxID=69896 RepID=UPI0035902893